MTVRRLPAPRYARFAVADRRPTGVPNASSAGSVPLLRGRSS